MLNIWGPPDFLRELPVKNY